MRILFLILMGVLTANAQVPPLLRGPFTTNDPTGQLTLATNIALSVATNRIASSNANYVLKNNGTATGLLSVQNQTNSGTMDVLGIFTAYDGIYSQLGGVISGDTFNINSSSSLVVDGSSSLNGRVYVSGPATNRFLILAADTAVTNLPFGSIVAGPGIQLATNNGVLWVTNTGQTVPVNTNLYQIASSVLTNLSNNAGNTVTNATPQFTITSGTLAGASGASWTNLNLYSPTNQPQASNQVGMTINGQAGQNTNLLQLKTNGVNTLTGVDAQGRIHVNKAVPTVAVDVTGAITASGAVSGGGVVLTAPFTSDTINFNNSQGPFICSVSGTELNIGGTGFSAMTALTLGKRDSNTHSIFLSSSPPQYFFRDGTKNSNCPVTVGTMIISNNFAPGTNAPVLTAYLPMSSAVAFQINSNGNVGVGKTPTLPLDVAGTARAFSLSLSNVNGTASTSLTTGATLSSNVYSYVFSSAGGTPLTLGLATNSNYPDGQIWSVTLGTEGTNYLSLTPTNFSAGTADKIYGSTNILLTPGSTLGIQKQGTNFNIISGLPSVPLLTVMDWYPNIAGACTNLSSFWAQCNGQTLVDAGSPFNGKTLPNFNNGIFLRGNTWPNLAATGGASTHLHTGTTDTQNNGYDINVDVTTPTVPSSANSHVHTFTTDAASSLPPYVDVVKIMRVK